MPASAVAPARFDLVGFHWQGPGRVLFRTRSQLGRWSAWRPAAPESEDRPDVHGAEARRRSAWRLGNPYWVGASDRIGYRLVGDVRRLRVWYVWSPVPRSTPRTLAYAGSPQVVSRQAWKADDEILRGRPRYAKAVSFAVVHHTAGSNELRQGRVGRDRSRHRALPRAGKRLERHRLQLSRRPIRPGVRGPCRRNRQERDRRARRGLQHRLGRRRRDRELLREDGHRLLRSIRSRGCSPGASTSLTSIHSGVVTWSSGGNPRYPRGARVRLRAISGHRDTGFTTCPGTAFYLKLPDLAHEVAGIGLPKLYEPVAGDRWVGRFGSPLGCRRRGRGP